MIKGSLAKRYARALMAIGQEEGVSARLGEELERFSRLAVEEETLRMVIKAPVISRDVRERVVAEIGQALGFHETMIRFLKLLNQKRRLPFVEQIARAYQELTDAAEGRARAEVVSAAPLSADAQARLQQALAALTGKIVIMTAAVDADLIGGVVTRVEGKLLDGSVRTQLRAMEEKLKATGVA